MSMSQLYPSLLDPKTLTRQVWDVNTARQIPGVTRALGLTAGVVSQMGLELFRGIEPLPRPRLLDQPDLRYDRPTWVRLQVEDYLLQGNAAHLVTVRDADGWPAAVRWYPAHQWHTLEQEGRQRWWLNGIEVPARDVVHVQNGADPLNPHRGVGVIEWHVRTLDRVALQEASERESLYGGGVPSVAIIMPPDDDSTDEELDDVADAWMERFGNTRERRPGFLPHGTEVKPLAWNPTDAQMVEARQMSLTDTANVFNLDAYWLGAKASSHTYRSPGPLFLSLLRTTLEQIIAPFEDAYSRAWVPRGKSVRFDRWALTADDLGSLVTTLTKATGGPVMTDNEARARLQLAPVDGGDTLRQAPTTDPAPEDDDDQDPTTEEGDPA